MDYNSRKITRHLQRQYATSVEQPLSWEIIDAFCALQERSDSSRRANHHENRTSGEGGPGAGSNHPPTDVISKSR